MNILEHVDLQTISFLKGDVAAKAYTYAIPADTDLRLRKSAIIPADARSLFQLPILYRRWSSEDQFQHLAAKGS